MKKLFVFLLHFVLLLILSCAEEDFNVPVIETLPVTDISAEGVTFNGRLKVKGKTRIVEYGFEWSVKGNPGDSLYRFKESLDPGEFEARLTDGLRNGQPYEVRAYVKNANDETYFGRFESFVSLGSASAVIESFSPQTGAPGTTVTMTGKHFGDSWDNVRITIGTTECQISSRTRTKIVFSIPSNYTTGSYPVKLQMNSRTFTTTSEFFLQGPLIQSITPIDGAPGTVVTISGSGFSSDSDPIVRFENVQATVNTDTDTEITVVVPNFPSTGPKTVSVTVAGLVAEYASKFDLTGPRVTSVSPLEVLPGATLTITGSGFSPSVHENFVNIHGYLVPALTSTPTKLEVKVPDVVIYEGPESSLMVSFGVQVGQLLADGGPAQIKILGPYVTTIEPSEQYEGRLVDIIGGNFRQDTKVTIEYDAEIVSRTPSKITVRVPYGVTTDEHQVRVINDQFVHFASTSLKTPTPWEALGDFPGEAAYGSVAFSIGGYHYVCMGVSEFGAYMKELWRFDPVASSWDRMADFPGDGRMDAFAFTVNGKAYVGGGGTSVENYYDMWEYDSQQDTWTSRTPPDNNVFFAYRGPATGIGNYGYILNESTFQRYDPAQDSWTTLSLPDGVYLYNDGIATTMGNKGYFGLGSSNETLWEFDPSTNSWRALASYGEIGLDCSTFTLNGELYIVNADRIRTIKPSINKWNSLPPVRGSTGAVAFSDGSVGYCLVPGPSTSRRFFVINPDF